MSPTPLWAQNRGAELSTARGAPRAAQLRALGTCGDNGEPLTPATSFVRHVRVSPAPSAPSFLPPAAVSMDTELQQQQQPQRGRRHRALHPFASHVPGVEPSPRPTGWLPGAAPAAPSGCSWRISHTRICSGAHSGPVGLFSCPGASRGASCTRIPLSGTRIPEEVAACPAVKPSPGLVNACVCCH